MSVEVSPVPGPLAMGSASIGNLYSAVSDDEAFAALDAAWDGGIRYFDTAPHYGLGLAERRLGAFLRTKPRDEYVLSTKVGRLLRPNPDFSGGSDIADGFAVPNDLMRVFDPSEAGVRQSLEESLERLGLDRVDVLYLHDPDVYDLDRGLAEGLPALATLRAEGLVSRVGVGVNDADVATQAVVSGLLDIVMIAGRYTLLDQAAADRLLPACADNGVGVVAAAVFNSGILARDTIPADATFNYGAADEATISRTRAIAAVCADFDVALPVAALQYPTRNPVVECVMFGSASPEAVRQNLDRAAAHVPHELWAALDAEGLTRPVSA